MIRCDYLESVAAMPGITISFLYRSNAKRTGKGENMWRKKKGKQGESDAILLRNAPRKSRYKSREHPSSTSYHYK